MVRLALALGLGSGLLLAGCGRTGTQSVFEAKIQLERPAVLTVDPDNQLPVVMADLDGAQIPFLVDTGASITTIHLARAEEHGLFVGPYSDRGIITGSGGGSIQYESYAAADRMSLGELTLENVRLPALEIELFEDVAFGGIIGQDLLVRLVLVIDMTRGELHLLPPDHSGGEEVQAYLGEAAIAGGTWIQAPIELRPCPFLEITHEDVSVGEIEIDTGASGTSLAVRTIDALELEPIGTRTSMGIDGEREGTTYALEDFGLYGFSISTEVKAAATDYGLLGMNVLGQFVFVVDGPASLFWLHHRELAESEGGDDDGAELEDEEPSREGE